MQFHENSKTRHSQLNFHFEEFDVSIGIAMIGVITCVFKVIYA